MLSFSGISDCVMVVGFEKMEKGSLGLKVFHFILHMHYLKTVTKLASHYVTFTQSNLYANIRIKTKKILAIF